MLRDQSDEVLRRVARQCRLAEMRVRRQEALWPAIQVGKVAAPAAGNQNLLADAIGAFQHSNTASALSGSDGAHQPSGASAQDYRIVGMDHEDSFKFPVSSFKY